MKDSHGKMGIGIDMLFPTWMGGSKGWLLRVQGLVINYPPHHPMGISWYICQHGFIWWLMFMGFHVGKYTSTKCWQIYQSHGWVLDDVCMMFVIWNHWSCQHVFFQIKPPELEMIPSLKLTHPRKIDPWKRRFLLETIMFRGYVSFRECKYTNCTL